MTTRTKIISFIFLAFTFSFCNKQKIINQKNTPILTVNLEKKSKVSIFDLFKKIEIIPLETTKDDLIKSISKIEYYNQKYYVLDRETSSLFCFDMNGNYMGNIGQMGKGPEDYYSAYDFLIDKNNNTIVILSQIGSMYFYDLAKRKLTDKVQLKNGPSNYQRFAMLNDDIFVFFTFSLEEKSQLFLFSRKQNRFINSFFKENETLSLFSNMVFYTFDDKVFFSKPFDNNIYTITESGMDISYTWNFENMNMNIKNFNLPSGRDERISKLLEMLQNSQLNSVCDVQCQTNDYYYTRLLRDLEHTLHIFYNKKTNQALVFEKFTEDVFFYPVYWNNDFVIATSSIYSKKNAINQKILDEENYQKLNHILEDDNPYIIKYMIN